MSLNKQMIIFIASMVMILLFGTFTLNLNNTKNFLQEQLQSHAQDTATSLGLSLSTIEDPEDISSMETMINAVFDRGYYAHITLNDMENIQLYHRENAKTMEDVPSWFINTIKLETPSAEALVQSGWIPVGTLSVSSHAGYAYIELWSTAKNLLLWFAGAAIIAILIVVYTLRLMLRPLKEMEKQAEAIVKKEYLIQDDLPTTTEFKRVVSAMNAMVYKLKAVFERDANTAEKLQKMAYQDSVTGLSNRRHFEMVIDSMLDPNQERPPGVICLLRVNELKEFNEQFGYLVGDKLMKALSDTMSTQLTHENTLFARLNGTELVAVMPGIQAAQIASATSNIRESMLPTLQELEAQESKTNISVAYTDYQPGQKRGPLLGNLDFAIVQAEKQGQNQVFYYNTKQDSSSEHESWEATLSQAISEKRFVLFQQSAYNDEHSVHDQELFIRLKDTDGQIRSAGYFMPAVEQLNKTAEIDELVINLALSYLKQHIETPMLAINLSKAVIENESFQQTVLQLFTDNKALAKRISIELPERLIIDQKGKAWPFLNNLKELGLQIGLDHFGARFGNMRYLQDLRPNYVKLDASFSNTIETDEETRNYVLSLCELTDSLDIKVIAMAVESEEQIKALSKLGVSYFQGYYYGAPTSLKG